MKNFIEKYDYIVKYKGNSFIETIFFAIVLIVICFLFGISHTKAASVPIEYFEFSFGGAHYPEFPINWSISKNDSGSKQLSIIGEGSEISKYSYAVLEICSNNKLEIEVTGGCTSSCFTRGDAYIYHTSKPCKAMNLNGTISYYEIRFETFQKNINDSAQYKIVSPMSFKNKNDSIAAVRLNGITLADYDMLSEKIENQENFDKLDKNQQQTNDKLDQAEETRKGIWGTIKSIFSKIGDLPGLIWNAIKGGFDAITSGLTSLGNFIGNALESLGNFIIEGLKSLFIPTDNQLYEIINDSKELTENFGFIGESVSFFLNIFTSLLGMVNGNGCIELPEFTIGSTSLFDSFTFWEARNVCLADNPILSSNIDTIRTITSIALVCLFIGFASSKFFNILSKTDNEINTGGVVT